MRKDFANCAEQHLRKRKLCRIAIQTVDAAASYDANVRQVMLQAEIHRWRQ